MKHTAKVQKFLSGVIAEGQRRDIGGISEIERKKYTFVNRKRQTGFILSNEHRQNFNKV